MTTHRNPRHWSCWSAGGSCRQCCGSVLIWSGSSILGRIPIRIRIQSRSRVLMTKNWTKFTAVKNFILFFLSKTTSYLSLGLHKRRPSYRRSLQLSKKNNPVLQIIKFLNFSQVIIFALLDPDLEPLTRPDWNRIQFGSGCATPACRCGSPAPFWTRGRVRTPGSCRKMLRENAYSPHGS